MIIEVQEMIGDARFTRRMNQKTAENILSSYKDESIKKHEFAGFREIPLYSEGTHAGYLRYEHVFAMSSTNPSQKVSRLVHTLRLKPAFFAVFKNSKTQTIPFDMLKV